MAKGNAIVMYLEQARIHGEPIGVTHSEVLFTKPNGYTVQPHNRVVCAKGKAYNRRMLVLFRRNFSGSVHEKPSDIRCRSLGCGILPCGIFNNAQKQQSRQVYQGNGFGGQCG